ncbi:MAG: hypothetical protein V1487_02190 [bacterium]
MMHTFEYCIEKKKDWGQVSELGELLVGVSGLTGVMIGEGVAFEGGEHGRIMAIREEQVEIMRLSRVQVLMGERVAATGMPIMTSCGKGVLGKMINGLGYAIGEGREKSKESESREIDTRPMGIVGRTRVTEYLETGISLLDQLVPIGHGQRELVIGDRKSGKTQLLLQILINQVRQGTVGIYCAIGKRASEIKRIEEYLVKHKIRDKCLIVASSAASVAGEVYVTPFTAMTHAEYFRDQGKNVLLILDDLSSHAKYYREIGLAAKQFPGRESYPGDVFHIQAKLLERAGNFLIKGKAKAITCLPVAESLLGDMTGFIQTNLMSITDGHWFLDTQIFHTGARPAVNVFLSVSRVGRQTQPRLVREVGEKLMTLLKESEAVSRFMQFGSELNKDIIAMVERSRRIRNVFNQVGGALIPLQVQLLVIMMAWHGYFDGKGVKELVEKYKKEPFTLKAKNWEELFAETAEQNKWQRWLI